MSRRFGRQQKRQFRALVAEQAARIAGLERSLAEAKAVSAERQRMMESQSRALNTVAEIFGPHFIALDPQTTDVSEHCFRAGLDMPFPTPLFSYEISSVRDIEMLSYKVRRLSVIATESWLDEMKGNMHIRVVSPSGQLGYAVTPGALQALGHSQLVRRMSHELAMLMAKELGALPVSRRMRVERPRQQGRNWQW